ncbi:hypothetical protein L6452_05301 [Arctium lappa]|uniref:Uncharacterized protein n=1 Tax=Arctium lappa TaxID=4217 RepID=A0ACB9EGN7_ARCLA|nr:hypothetical protein L6452_05301 [Arctium lappa]
MFTHFPRSGTELQIYEIKGLLVLLCFDLSLLPLFRERNRNFECILATYNRFRAHTKRLGEFGLRNSKFSSPITLLSANNCSGPRASKKP